MFINQECRRDQISEGFPYVIGPTPFVAYTLDGFRVEIASAAPAQVFVSRQAGLLGEKNCIQFVTTIQKGSTANDDNDNLECWIDPDDLAPFCWGTPYAKPMCVSFDSQFPAAGPWSFSMINWNDTVFCAGTITSPAANAVMNRDVDHTYVVFPPMTTGDWSQGAKFLTDLGSGDTWGTSTVGAWLSGHAWHVAGANRLTTMAPGSTARFGRFQADIGTVPQPFRYMPPEQQLLRCQRELWKSMPQGVGVNRAAPAGYPGAISFFGDPNAAAGMLCYVRLPTEMILTPSVYTFSAGLPNDSHWFRANGSVQSGAPGIVQVSPSMFSLSNPAVGDPNGSSYFVHAVVSAQRGGNGWL